MYKLVKENLLEFQKGLDPVNSLGMGRVHMIEDWLNSMYILRYKINGDFTIDVNGDVLLMRKNLKEFPEFIQFGVIYGEFTIQYNEFISLRGCPKVVHTMFSCSNNKLTSLDGAPKFVNKSFYCHSNLETFSEEYVRSICNVGDKIRNLQK